MSNVLLKMRRRSIIGAGKSGHRRQLNWLTGKNTMADPYRSTVLPWSRNEAGDVTFETPQTLRELLGIAQAAFTGPGDAYKGNLGPDEGIARAAILAQIMGLAAVPQGNRMVMGGLNAAHQALHNRPQVQTTPQNGDVPQVSEDPRPLAHILTDALNAAQLEAWRRGGLL